MVMRSRLPLGGTARSLRRLHRPHSGIESRRAIQISATATSESPLHNGDVLSNSIDACTDTAGNYLFDLAVDQFTNLYFVRQMLDSRF